MRSSHGPSTGLFPDVMKEYGSVDLDSSVRIVLKTSLFSVETRLRCFFRPQQYITRVGKIIQAHSLGEAIRDNCIDPGSSDQQQSLNPSNRRSSFRDGQYLTGLPPGDRLTNRPVSRQDTVLFISVPAFAKEGLTADLPASDYMVKAEIAVPSPKHNGFSRFDLWWRQIKEHFIAYSYRWLYARSRHCFPGEYRYLDAICCPRPVEILSALLTTLTGDEIFQGQEVVGDRQYSQGSSDHNRDQGDNAGPPADVSHAHGIDGER